MRKFNFLFLLFAGILISSPSFSAFIKSPYPVPKGGTGVASLNAYDVILGGTTSTGAIQQVSGEGTLGQVLTSGGASALPTWASAGNSTSSTATASYTPTFGADFGTVTSIAMYWWRLGDRMFVQGNFNTGTLSNVTAGGISLAGSHSIDTAKIGNQTLGSPCTIVGQWATDSSSAGFTGNVLACVTTSATVVYLSNQFSGNRNTTAGSFFGIGFSNNFMTVQFNVPISGWTNSN